jgi:hypothetical protein
MNATHKAAAKASKAGQTMFVVYVPDEGMRVFDAAQMKIWAPLVHTEAVYLDGQQINEAGVLV